LLGKSLHYVEGGLGAVNATPGQLLVSIHACGTLSDAVLDCAVEGRAMVAVMPCCHSLRRQIVPPVPGLTAEVLKSSAAAIGPAAAIDNARMEGLVARGYSVTEQYIDPAITPYNHVILAQPESSTQAAATRLFPSSTVLASASASAVAAKAAKKAAAKPWQPSIIPLADVEAVAAMAGRRAAQWSRGIEVSLWLPEHVPLDAAAIAEIARRASTAAWRPKCDAEAAAAKKRGVVHWDAAQAVAEVMALDPAVAKGKEEQQVEVKLWSSGEPPAVSVVLREVYWAKNGDIGEFGTQCDERGRRACNFRIEFQRKGRAGGEAAHAISKGEVSLWQARVREALGLWAAGSDEAGLPGPFELR
jgi:hypothetical protein